MLDLLVEVEALRTVVLAEGFEASARYAQAYREVARLSHNAAGPSSGYEKLLERFYPEHTVTSPESPFYSRSARERLLLARLGLSADEIADFEEHAARAECFT